MFLLKQELLEIINSKQLIIRPLLNPNQVGELTIDFRLGTDFLVSSQGRYPVLDLSFNHRNTTFKNFFKPTRRKIGQYFTFYPMQTILCSSLEYIKMPLNIYAILSMRSSYSRAGFNLSTIIQPGYCGCISLELTNVNNNPIKVNIGARIFQARFYRLGHDCEYDYAKRKYVAQVRPESTKFDNELEFEIIKKINDQ